MNRLPRRSVPRIVAAALVIGLAAGASACSSSDQGASGETTSAPRSTTTSALPPGAEDLVGRWAHFDAVAYQDDTMKTLIISTGLADVEERDGKLWNRMRFCHADTANDLGSTVTFSDAATRAIVPVDVELKVSEQDGALHVERPATPTPIGIDLDDPATESLPTDPKDPRFVDSDGDGKPGVTAKIEVSPQLKGEIYLARREIFAYDITATSPDRLEGTITDGSEQVIIGSSDPVFAQAGGNWKQIDDPERNPVIWVRVDDTWDCDRLAAERDRLFPPNPKADW